MRLSVAKTSEKYDQMQVITLFRQQYIRLYMFFLILKMDHSKSLFHLFLSFLSTVQLFILKNLAVSQNQTQIVGAEIQNADH